MTGSLRVVTQEDDWRSTERPTTRISEFEKGRIIFRILSGGIESRTSVPAKTRDPARSKVGSPEDIVSKGKPEDSSKERGPLQASLLRRNRQGEESALREAIHWDRYPRRHLPLLKFLLCSRLSILER